jgi:hypothetical protein
MDTETSGTSRGTNGQSTVRPPARMFGPPRPPPSETAAAVSDTESVAGSAWLDHVEPEAFFGVRPSNDDTQVPILYRPTRDGTMILREKGGDSVIIADYKPDTPLGFPPGANFTYDDSRSEARQTSNLTGGSASDRVPSMTALGRQFEMEKGTRRAGTTGPPVIWPEYDRNPGLGGERGSNLKWYPIRLRPSNRSIATPAPSTVTPSAQAPSSDAHSNPT